MYGSHVILLQYNVFEFHLTLSPLGEHGLLSAFHFLRLVLSFSVIFLLPTLLCLQWAPTGPNW